jgi:hypothetical protein
VLTRDERGAHTGGDHGVPAPHRLLPERLGPREPTVGDHSFVSAPGDVHEDVEPAGFALDLLENVGDGLVVGVVARESGRVGAEVRVADATAGRVDLHAGVGQSDRDAAPDTATGAGNQRDVLTQSGHVFLVLCASSPQHPSGSVAQWSRPPRATSRLR